MTYVTYVWRSDVATSDNTVVDTTVGGSGQLISGGWVVATPSSSGWTPITISDTAICSYNGPSGISSMNSTISPSNWRVRVRGIKTGEALWVTVMYLQ